MNKQTNKQQSEETPQSVFSLSQTAKAKDIQAARDVLPVVWDNFRQLHEARDDIEKQLQDIQRTLSSFVRVVVFATIMVAWAVVNGGV